MSEYIGSGDVVWAVSSGSVSTSKGRERVTAGEPWDRNDVTVRENPGYFTDGPERARRVGGQTVPVGPPADGPVEQATAGPGEKREVRRSKRA